MNTLFKINNLMFLCFVQILTYVYFPLLVKSQGCELIKTDLKIDENTFEESFEFQQEFLGFLNSKNSLDILIMDLNIGGSSKSYLCRIYREVDSLTNLVRVSPNTRETIFLGNDKHQALSYFKDNLTKGAFILNCGGVYGDRTRVIIVREKGENIFLYTTSGGNYTMISESDKELLGENYKLLSFLKKLEDY